MKLNNVINLMNYHFICKTHNYKLMLQFYRLLNLHSRCMRILKYDNHITIILLVINFKIIT
jgi:hypothetical protein